MSEAVTSSVGLGAMLTAALAIYGGSLARAEGLRFDPPGPIDTAATLLFAQYPPQFIERIDDTKVNISVPGLGVLQLSRIANGKCRFRTALVGATDPVIQQYNFDQLTGEYQISGPFGVSEYRFRVHGDGFYCMKDDQGLRCQASYDLSAPGEAGALRLQRALRYMLTTFCPPRPPKAPF